MSIRLILAYHNLHLQWQSWISYSLVLNKFWPYNQLKFRIIKKHWHNIKNNSAIIASFVVAPEFSLISSSDGFVLLKVANWKNLFRERPFRIKRLNQMGNKRNWESLIKLFTLVKYVLIFVTSSKRKPLKIRRGPIRMKFDCYD